MRTIHSGNLKILCFFKTRIQQFTQLACRQMEFGVQGIFGPSDPVLGAHIQSICEALDVPHLEARIDFEPHSKELSINLHPSQEHMNKAFKDLMMFLNWTKVAIVYEEDYVPPFDENAISPFFIFFD
ncbi:hypothetical protein HHI36_018317 [Cryptolaemus montrouzieri]|uniref:Receptor ligand binding region domain-containing protein n=1 Tax=Cryptolaemus montrouzieri TaxID=559131 RepID=A0ABD2NZU5_9CUCU